MAVIHEKKYDLRQSFDSFIKEENLEKGWNQAKSKL
jgi:hypothetical protein